MTYQPHALRFSVTLTTSLSYNRDNRNLYISIEGERSSRERRPLQMVTPLVLNCAAFLCTPSVLTRGDRNIFYRKSPTYYSGSCHGPYALCRRYWKVVVHSNSPKVDFALLSFQRQRAVGNELMLARWRKKCIFVNDKTLTLDIERGGRYERVLACMKTSAFIHFPRVNGTHTGRSAS